MDNWAWYFSRSSALVGFLLLYVSIFLGLSIRTPGLKKIIPSCYSARIHRWISLQALLFAFLHGASLFFDKFLNFSWKNIFIPFYPLGERLELAGIHLVALSFGIIAFYLMFILTVSSYGKKFIPHSFWRLVHFLNVGLYVISVGHALRLGSDLRAGLAREIFVWANICLGILFLGHLVFRISSYFYSKPKIDEDLCESDAEVVSK